MRITFVYGAYPPIPDGGAGFIDNLSKVLVKKGHVVSVITTDQVAAHYQNRKQPSGVKVLPVVSDWRVSLTGYKQLRDAVRESDPQVCHVVYPSATFGDRYQLPMLLKLAGRVPLVTTLYGFGFRQGVVNQIAALTLLHASKVLASDNDRVMSLIRKYLPYLSKRIRYIPSGSNIIQFTKHSGRVESLRERLGLDPNRFYTCYFGYLNAERGLETLFRALKGCMDRGMDIGLIMIGTGPKTCLGRGDANYFRYLSDLANELDIAENIVWTEFGTEEEVAQYFQCSDICTLPYRKNTLGHSSLPAALSFGLPVITTLPYNRTDVKPLVHGVNSVLVAPDDPSGLEAAIEEMLVKPHLRSSISDGAYELWKEVFSWDAISDRVLQVYKEVSSTEL